ncbi:MAG: MBL fold metallo-hydrolase RNA specificity domain-containing protein [Calditrichaceae bacterium]
MFSYDKDILINDIGLWLDAGRVKEFGFISHAHGDHIARHKKIICTPVTGKIIEKRLKSPNYTSLEYHKPLKINSSTITLYPAGHILGSAQIKIENTTGSLLYTGDFRLRPAKTVEPFEFVKTDILIMETTFGLPHYKMPPREEIEHYLIEQCKKLLKEGRIPVVFSYSLGKGQEVMKILTEAGLPVAVDYGILRFVPYYQAQGVEFGRFEKFRRSEFRGKVLLLPTGARYQRYLKDLRDTHSFYISGWGIDPSAPKRLGVDEVLPISDHADYDELIELVERIKPEVVYCTHGFPQFVDSLRNAGYNAFELGSVSS